MARLEFRQTDPEGGWFPWEAADGDLLDKAVAVVLEAHGYVLGDAAVGVTITAWDGTLIEYVNLPDGSDSPIEGVINGPS